MIDIRRTPEFTEWLEELRDRKAQARIVARIDRLKHGNYGDVKAVGDGVSEMRIDFGPGYRVYFARIGKVTLLLLCGGDKSSQQSDINRAKEIAGSWEA